MTDKPKIVDLSLHRSEEEDKDKAEWRKEMHELIDGLKKAIDEHRLTQIVLQYECKVPKEEQKEDGPDHSTRLVNWNKDYDADKALGYAARLYHRLFLIIEGIMI